MREHNDESFEFEVSVIGLGAMGTIMAQALLRQGRRVAIWNRSPGKDYTTNARDEGLALQSLVNRAGGHYVKGMIVAYPRNVGRRESHSIHTGDPE
ncbi:NAD(P)-dependent oxidoreductase, partial [Escherichia coli]